MSILTPAFVYDEAALRRALSWFAPLRADRGFKLLFSIKALPFVDILECLRPLLDGFSVSSLFEARLAREVLADKGVIHITTPGLRADELPEITRRCDHVSFNSLPQWRRCRERARLAGGRCGLRINPGVSHLGDPRYDPCRPHSKLGAALDEVRSAWDAGGADLAGLGGVHFHTMHAARDLSPLTATLARVEEVLGAWLSSLEWINLGGGYYIDRPEAVEEFARIVARLQRRYGLEVLFEPGKAVVGEAASLIASVVDVFPSEGRLVAVLDTTVAHLPEVFEYQQSPALREAVGDGRHRYLIAGASCLAGDLFGDYAFAAPLGVGDRVTFDGIGAYSLVKASRFNGINLPAIYAKENTGRIVLKKRYDYLDYRDQWVNGADPREREGAKPWYSEARVR
ncbi:MAG: carboxynorspermidine decarboxylase [Gammaproteobacteria bacterium]